jgi:hypothetical protein
LHNEHSLQCTRGIKAIPRFRARCPWENANPLVVSDSIWTHTSRPGQISRTKSFRTAILHHEKYELWNAFQSQDVCDESEGFPMKSLCFTTRVGAHHISRDVSAVTPVVVSQDGFDAWTIKR